MTAHCQLSTLFDEGECHQRVNPEWSERTLLNQPGLFSFSKIARALKLESKYLLTYLNGRAALGQWDLEKEFGLFKPPQSRWRVNLQVFRQKLQPLRERFSLQPLQRVPKGIQRDDFFKQQSIFRMNDVISAGFLPVTQREIVAHIEDLELDRRTTGAWKRGHEWRVDFVPFILFVAAYQKSITLEEAKNLASEHHYQS